MLYLQLGRPTAHVAMGRRRSGQSCPVTATQRRDVVLLERGFKLHDRNRKLFKRILFVFEEMDTRICSK